MLCIHEIGFVCVRLISASGLKNFLKAFSHYVSDRWPSTKQRGLQFAFYQFDFIGLVGKFSWFSVVCGLIFVLFFL